MLVFAEKLLASGFEKGPKVPKWNSFPQVSPVSERYRVKSTALEAESPL